MWPLRYAGGASQDQIADMMKALLTDRFQLKVHHETKEFSVYALVVTKGGPKLKESALDPVNPNGPAKPPVDVAVSGSRNGVNINLGRGAYFRFRGQQDRCEEADDDLFSRRCWRASWINRWWT